MLKLNGPFGARRPFLPVELDVGDRLPKALVFLSLLFDGSGIMTPSSDGTRLEMLDAAS